MISRNRETVMGFEIADVRGLGQDLSGEMVVYIETGPNPITEEAWATYTPDPGWILNTPRGSQFDVLNVLGSPYVPTGEFTYYTDQSGFTWLAVAAVQNRAYPFDPDDYSSLEPPPSTSAQAGYALVTPLPGTVQYNSNDKNHENIYYAENEDGSPKVQYYVTDAWGNVYILKSVNEANDTPEKIAAAVDAAVLPDGWVTSTGYLDEDTSYFPVYSGDLAHANEFRDSADSAWMQIGWASSGITLPAMVGDGMPIWGGNDDGAVQGTSADDEIHGGDGSDTLYGMAGDDTIWGDAGNDTILGDDGSDIIDGDSGDDTLNGGEAGSEPNRLSGGADNDTASYAGTTGTVYADLRAQAGYVDGVLTDDMDSIENLTGGSGINTLVGDDGANVLVGGGGTDYLYGEGGDDTLIGGTAGSAPNQLWGGAGNDTASYAGTTGTVHADLGARAGYVDGVLVDQMDSIENLVGGSSADTLVGDSGANLLTGGEGGDSLWGKGGADVFAYATFAASSLVAGYDTIADFVSGTSRLDLTALQTDAAHVAIVSDAQSTSLYVQQSLGSFNASTDLAISFVGAGAIAMGDIRF
jgi:Ca2+-binding RTX toxin-like protein